MKVYVVQYRGCIPKMVVYDTLKYAKRGLLNMIPNDPGTDPDDWTGYEWREAPGEWAFINRNGKDFCVEGRITECELVED